MPILCSPLCSPTQAIAHQSIDTMIVLRSAAIAREPAKPGLWLARGELHREHRAWPAARADMDRAEALAPGSLDVQMARCRLALDMANGAAAQMHAERVIKSEPRNADALLLRARALRLQNKASAAAGAFEQALAASPAASPDLYLETATAWRAVGLAEGGRALAVLDRGTTQLGLLAALQSEAIAIERTLGRPLDALARVDRMLQQAARKETWLARRGDVLLDVGRPRAAADAYRETLQAIAELPPWIRQHTAVQQLEQQVERQLRSLGHEGDTTP
jgi:tetratricopeptide (TPR) repeat protein